MTGLIIWIIGAALFAAVAIGGAKVGNRNG